MFRDYVKPFIMRVTPKFTWFNKIYQRWIVKNIPAHDSIKLDRKNIFILPTGSGLLFVFTSVIIFIAAINYAVSLAFGLAL